MAQVYRQCRLVLRPGGVMAVVIKRYVKNGAIVPLPDQTWDLLLSLGFLPLERVRAMLVKETRRPDLFGGEVVTEVKRTSFFRKLHERKDAARETWKILTRKQRYRFAGQTYRQKPHLSRKRFLEAAQMLAYDYMRKRDEARKAKTRIEWEDVLFLMKASHA